MGGRRANTRAWIAVDAGAGVNRDSGGAHSAVARARNWHGRIVAREINSIDQLAQSAGVTQRYVRHILLCVSLSRRLSEDILMGRHRANLTVKTISQGVPLSWQEQES